jgi:methylated-DNA-[protein]-cysteine S-methyltransferase
MNFHTSIDSPIGPLLLISDREHLIGLYMDAHKGGPGLPEDSREEAGDPILRRATDQLRAYFAGELQQFDLPTLGQGTDFQRQCWHQLALIPYAETISYGEMAKRVGDPKACRAVGAANGRNPISIVVPCHRVIGANGSLVGFGGGLDRKAKLIGFERAMLFGESAGTYWS